MLEPNQVFHQNYRVVRLLAQGGMGAVYEAQHRFTEARVALKLLWPQVMQIESAVKTFALEAKIAARIESENIVQVLDAGFDEERSAPFLVMELLEGHTLGSLVQQHGRLPAARVVELLAQVARGLDAAHSYRQDGQPSPIIHRDLKPENLFLARRAGGREVVKILDFGIAKVLTASTHVSREIRGTPMYMAYEQVAGEPLSPQTDVWSLGLIAYYLLTGKRYWRAANSPDAGLQTLFAEILNKPLVAPSQRIAEDGLPSSLPAAFDAWLLRCIDRNPEARFSSAGDAVVQLAVVLGESSGPSVSQTVAEEPAAQAALQARPSQELSSPSLPATAAEQKVREARMPARRLWPYGAAFSLVGLGLGLWLIGQPPTRPTPRPATAPAPPDPTLGAHSASGPEAPTLRAVRGSLSETTKPRPAPRIPVRPLRDSELLSAQPSPQEASMEETLAKEAARERSVNETPEMDPPASAVAVPRAQRVQERVQEPLPQPHAPHQPAHSAPNPRLKAEPQPVLKAEPQPGTDCVFDPYTGKCK